MKPMKIIFWCEPFPHHLAEGRPGGGKNFAKKKVEVSELGYIQRIKSASIKL